VEELDNGLTLKRYRGDSAMEKMGEIDLDKMEIRLVDTDWLGGELLAHELAHFERYKGGNVINKISGHFGDIAIWVGVYFVSMVILTYLGIVGSTFYNYVTLPIAGGVLALAIVAKLIEEHKADNMISEMKEKYDLGVEEDESD